MGGVRAIDEAQPAEDIRSASVDLDALTELESITGIPDGDRR
jgi:hypothetical protein